MRFDPLSSFLVKLSHFRFLGGSIKLVNVLVNQNKLSVEPVVLYSLLQLNNLVLEKLVEELTKLIQSHLARLIVAEDLEDMLMAVDERGVDLPWNLVS